VIRTSADAGHVSCPLRVTALSSVDRLATCSCDTTAVCQGGKFQRSLSVTPSTPVTWIWYVIIVHYVNDQLFYLHAFSRLYRSIRLMLNLNSSLIT